MAEGFSFEEAIGYPQQEQPAASTRTAAATGFSFEEASKPQAPTGPRPEMPTVGTALLEGMGAGYSDAIEGAKLFAGSTSVSSQSARSPVTDPLELSDIYSPISRAAPKLAYGLGQSAPTLTGGLMGGFAGAATPVPGGAIIGGALGAGAASALQTIGPYFGEELRKSPGNPEDAWTRAMQRASTSGTFSALGWGLFPVRFFQGPLKQAAFQIFGVQPGVSVGENTIQNIMQGKPSEEGAMASYAHGAIGTAIPAAGHAMLSNLFRDKQSVAARRASDPILSRLGEHEESKGWIPDFNRLYTSIKDNLHPIKEVESFLFPGMKIPAHESPYILGRLVRGSAGKAEHYIDFATFDPVTRQNTGKGLKQIIEPVVDDLDGFRKYMLARRAIEKDAQGIETGIPIPEAVSAVRQGGAKFGQVFADWQRYQDALLDLLVKSGVVGREDAARMRALNRDYVPFYRLMEEPETFFGKPGAGLTVRNPIMGMRGSEAKILDPIETTVKNTFLYMSLADRNMALQALEKMAARSPRGSEVMERVGPEVHPVRVTGKETERALTKQGLVTLPSDPEAFTIFRPNAFRPAPDRIAIFNDGKRTIYKVDPYLGEAINGLNQEAMGSLQKLLSIPAKTLRAGATLTPEFMVRNTIRDQFSAFVFSSIGRGYVPFYDLIKNIGTVFTQGKGYQEWLKSGGANSAMVSIDRNYVENLIRRLRDPTVMGTVRNVAKSPLDILRAMSELTENSTRVAEFMRLRKHGESMETSGFGSREATLDFQRIGAKMQFANSAIAFFNAQAEGVDRAFRAMINHPMRFAATVSSAITLPSVYLWYANKDDPRMKEIPRWQKDIFWIVPTDNWQPISEQDAGRAPKGYTRQKEDGTWEINNGSIWRIPKPFELGVIFGSVPERILDAYYAKDPNAFKNVLPSIKQAFLPNFVPQFASPVIEQFANESLFTGRPLVPRYMEGVLPKEQYNPYTTDTAKQIGNFVSKIPGLERSSFASPIIIENYIRAWTGGLGKHALDLSDGALRGAGIAPTRINPTMTNADKTLIKAFAVRFPEAGANSIQDFYDEYHKRQQLKKTAAHLRKTGAPEQASDIIRNNTLAMAEGIHKSLGAHLKLVRDTYRNTTMSPDEKRKFIDTSYLQMIKISQAGNDVFKRTADAFESKKKASGVGGWETTGSP